MAKRKAKSTAPAAKYSPKPEERAAIEKAFEERKIAPAPRLKVENNTITIDHPDKAIGQLLMQNALGTLDAAFMLGLLKQLAKATSGGSNVDEADLNFMVSFLKGIEPRDQLESTLAAQMATVHMALMKFINQLPRIETLPQQDSAERAINKFARTFAAQMEALKRYRTGGGGASRSAAKSECRNRQALQPRQGIAVLPQAWGRTLAKGWENRHRRFD
jgi:hypothetical protein